LVNSTHAPIPKIISPAESFNDHQQFKAKSQGNIQKSSQFKIKLNPSKFSSLKHVKSNKSGQTRSEVPFLNDTDTELKNTIKNPKTCS
jgi:hypothetical protein